MSTKQITFFPTITDPEFDESSIPAEMRPHFRALHEHLMNNAQNMRLVMDRLQNHATAISQVNAKVKSGSGS